MEYLVQQLGHFEHLEKSLVELQNFHEFVTNEYTHPIRFLISVIKIK